jgi:hypothetical protein
MPFPIDRAKHKSTQHLSLYNKMNLSTGPAKGSWSDQEVEKLRVLIENVEADQTLRKLCKDP